GTQRDLSHLVDFLPSYLFPNGERIILQGGVAGISLGGHTTWLALAHAESRITFWAVILGCTDYLALTSRRAGIELALSTLPPPLVSLVHRMDPVQRTLGIRSWVCKKILVLRSVTDRLVPWSASALFVRRLEVGEGGFKKIIAQEEDIGHKCTEEMSKWMAELLGYERYPRSS
ncbi:hypothetical protein BDN71DRAFT_1394215, partial [Pleurotus eryngii]